MGFKELEELKQMIVQMSPDEFVETFLMWLENHDDTDIECWSDVVISLHEECENELACAAEAAE